MGFGPVSSQTGWPLEPLWLLGNDAQEGEGTSSETEVDEERVNNAEKKTGRSQNFGSPTSFTKTSDIGVGRSERGETIYG